MGINGLFMLMIDPLLYLNIKNSFFIKTIIIEKVTIIMIRVNSSKPFILLLGIIIMGFLPIFTLEGVEGKMFSPMAFTITFALLGSMIATLVVTPALAHYLTTTLSD